MKKSGMSSTSVHGQWHGHKYYFGLHYDFHAGPTDTDIEEVTGTDPWSRENGTEEIQ